MRPWCDIAELTNTKHLNGGFVVHVTASFPFLLHEGMELRLVPPVLDAPRCVIVEDAEETGVDCGVVWFRGINDVEAAKSLVGCHCLAPRAEVNELSRRAVIGEGELDIEGWEAYDDASGYLGLVAEVREMPGQLMLVIDRSSCEPLLVPLVDEFILNVDELEKRIDLQLPDGLLTL